MVHLAMTADLVLDEGTKVGQKLTYVFIQQLWLSVKKIKPKIEVSELESPTDVNEFWKRNLTNFLSTSNLLAL